MSSAKAALVIKLADLLGFEEGANDVLEYLLSIESSEDLLLYLSQLLGQEGERVQSFVDDVGTFQRGGNVSSVPTVKSISSRTNNQQDNHNSATAATSRRQQAQDKNYMVGATTRTDKQRERQPTQTQKGKKAMSTLVKLPSQSRVVTEKKTQLPQRIEGSNAKPTSNVSSPPVINELTQKQEQSNSTKPPQKLHPPKGKASYVCGCFGTVHKALTNCLYCGRISCAKEGYDFCPFCGLLVEKVQATPPDDGVMNEAWLHKERLLQFDREFARRTVILDDQEDFYANSTSTWLTEEEKHEAQGKVEDRQNELNHRKKQTMSLEFL